MDREKFIELVNSGCGMEAMVAATGMSKIDVLRVCAEEMVLTRLRLNDKRPRVWTAPICNHRVLAEQTLIDAVASGKSAKALAIEHGISTQAVYERAKKAGLVFPKRIPKKKRSKVSKVYGISLSLLKKLQANGATRAYQYQRRNASERGIGWELTLAQWWDIWESSGHWEQRGRGKGCYVMGRHADKGPYAVGNVVICSQKENIAVREIYNPSWMTLKKRQRLGLAEGDGAR